jgi:hypothetical protein
LQLDGAEGFVLLKAIGGLMQLTQLRLFGNERMTQHGLMQLTGLPRLQKQHCELLQQHSAAAQLCLTAMTELRAVCLRIYGQQCIDRNSSITLLV